MFADILEREDRRMIGSDGLLEFQLASSPFIEVRAWCAVAMGRIGDPRVLPVLYGALHSEYAAVRGAAAFAVGLIEDKSRLDEEGRVPDKRSIDLLVRLLNDPSTEVRMRAAEAIGRTASAAGAGAILSSLHRAPDDGSGGTRAFIGTAIIALERIGSAESLAVLRSLASSADPQIQYRAAGALIRLQDKSAVGIFLDLLSCTLPDIQALGARGVGICQDPALAGKLLPLIPSLGQRTGRSIPLQVRVCAVQALALLKNQASVPAIAAAIIGSPVTPENPDQVNFAIQAAEALGQIGADAAEPALVQLLAVPGPAANAAGVALARVLKARPDEFFRLVKPALFREAAGARAWARALGELGDARATEELKMVLIRAAADHAAPEDLLAVPAVITALAKTNTSDMAEILPPYLSSHDDVILRAAIEAYKPSPGAREAWAPLTKAYENISAGNGVETKIAILERLESWLHQPAVQECLLSALHDRLRNVRIVAARLLRQSGLVVCPEDPGASETRTSREAYALVAAARKDQTIALMETTKGHVEIGLFREDAPMTVANFVSLARQGFFDGLSFMRVVPFFVVQTGDPRNDQEGGPGYYIRCEINMRPFERGSVGMALSGKDTGGSQFFITMSPQPHLDGSYTCFGRVLSGMQVIDRLVEGDRILKVTINEDRTALEYRQY